MAVTESLSVDNASGIKVLSFAILLMLFAGFGYLGTGPVSVLMLVALLVGLVGVFYE